MKNFYAVLKIQSLTGVSTRKVTIKAKTLKSAEKKAWEMIGNQSGEVITIDDKLSPEELHREW